MGLISMVLFGLLGVLALWLSIWVLTLRTVVPPNDVHIVQARKLITAYGHGHNKNVYYAWPSWVPLWGVKTTRLTVSIFNVNLHDYAAYDKGRVPFRVDVAAFFRIDNADMAAQRVGSFEQLISQLQSVLQGAARTILARHDIEEILEGRSQFGEAFTQEVSSNLKAWGVEPVKQIELMDIRDGDGDNVIEAIMAKKKSLIEMQSRVEVAQNTQRAETAEIEATQTVEIRRQESVQQIGQRTAAQEREVGIAKEKASQEVQRERAVTTEREMQVQRVKSVKQAEINRDVHVVAADQERQTAVIRAEGEKQNAIIVAEGQKEAALLNAEAIQAEGRAKGEAERALLQAPVDTQIVLAREIGGNEGYQDYLIRVRAIEKEQAVGVAQAEALKVADIKVIAQAGSAPSGIESVGDVFSSKGGMALGAALEALASTPTGGAVVRKLTGGEAGRAA